MQEKDHISELFKETFNNHEAPVRPELWEQVASRIQTPATPSLPDGATATHVVGAASNAAGGFLAWVAGAAILISASAGVYYYNLQTTVNSAQEGVSVTDPGTANTISETQTPQLNAPSEKFPTTPGSVINSTTKSNSAGSDLNAIENTSDPLFIDPQPHNSSSQNKTAVDESLISDRTNDQTSADNGSSTLSTPGSAISDPVPSNSNLQTSPSHGNTQREEVSSGLTIHNISNIFTPNGDGTNDMFIVNPGEGVNIEVSVYNSRGHFITRFNGPDNGWNGKLKNLDDAPEGTYFYVIFATGKNGEKNTQKGSITLKR